jgi:hypothetical protein
LDLHAQYLDERTRGIPGRRAELQRPDLSLMPGDAAVETGQVVGGCAELRRQFYQLHEQTISGVDLLDGDVDATLGESGDRLQDFLFAIE